MHIEKQGGADSVRSVRKKAISGVVCMVVRLRKEKAKLMQLNLNIHVTEETNKIYKLNYLCQSLCI